MDDIQVIDIKPEKKNSMKINSKSSNSSSSEDEQRLEMRWTQKQEDYINDIKLECEDDARRHYNYYTCYKYLYNVVSLPLIIIPLLLSGLEQYIGNDLNYVKSILFCFIGITNSIVVFLNIGQRFQKHLEANNKYLEFTIGIGIELVKPKKYRESVEVFLEKIKYKKIQLDENSPEF